MTNAYIEGDREPRYLWRRGFGFLLDLLLAQLVVALLFAAVDGAAGTSLGDSPSISATECRAASPTHPQVVRVDGLWPLPQGWQRKNTICHYGTGQDESWTFTTRAAREDGGTRYFKEVSYDIDRSGKALPIEYAADLTPFAVVLLFVGLTASGWRSPGKAVMGLRIKTTEGGAPGWRHAFKREVVKLLPLVVFGAFTFWVALASPAFFTDSEALLIDMRDSGMMTSFPY